jgi:hypothetical protein
MADLVDELSNSAKALPPEDRARLAEELLASLGGRIDAVEIGRAREAHVVEDHHQTLAVVEHRKSACG